MLFLFSTRTASFLLLFPNNIWEILVNFILHFTCKNFQNMVILYRKFNFNEEGAYIQTHGT